MISIFVFRLVSTLTLTLAGVCVGIGVTNSTLWGQMVGAVTSRNFRAVVLPSILRKDRTLFGAVTTSIKALEFCLTWNKNEMTVHPPRALRGEKSYK